MLLIVGMDQISNLSNIRISGIVLDWIPDTRSTVVVVYHVTIVAIGYGLLGLELGNLDTKFLIAHCVKKTGFYEISNLRLLSI